MTFLKYLTIWFFLFVASQVTANDIKQNTFDLQQPDNVSDKKWGNLKLAIEEIKLLPTPNGVAAASNNFGDSVYIEGDRAVIGAQNEINGGVAYIFDFNGNFWEETQLIRPLNGLPGDKFGSAVSLSGDRILIGASNNDNIDTNAGSAYVFDLINGSWVQTVQLLASDGASGDFFGDSVSLDADTAVVSSRNDDDNGSGSGSVYVFGWDGANWQQIDKLKASDAAQGDNFGYSVSLFNTRLLIGSTGDDDNGSSSGSAYIFDKINSVWQQSNKLIALDGASGDGFGRSVSLSNNRALIGAYRDDDGGSSSGSAYVFDLSGITWSQSAKLVALDAMADDFFGQSVSLFNDRALVGAYKDDNLSTDSGSAYIFELSGITWSQTDKLLANDADTNDWFGFSVGLSGNTILIGSYLDDDTGSGSGSAYVYDISGTNWIESQKVLAKEGAENDRFGYSVSMSGDRALIGASGDDFLGSAYVFDLTALGWQLTTKLFADDAMLFDGFGYSVSLSGDRALIGAPSNGAGSAYLFDLSSNTWSQTQKLLANDGTSGDFFGESVSLSGNKALIGASRDDDNGLSSGSAYIFELTNSGWLEMDKLLPFDGTDNDFFGKSVSLLGNRALVGAYRNDDGVSPLGAAYVFDLDGMSWSETKKLIADDASNGDEFGIAVSLSNDRALIGAPQSDGLVNGSGSAYIFDYDGMFWTQTTKLFASDGSNIDEFGRSVGLFDDKAVVGSYLDSTNNDLAVGSAYVFKLTGNAWSQADKLTDSTGREFDQMGVSVSISGDKVLVGSHMDDESGTDSGSAFVFNINPIFTIGGVITGLDMANDVTLENNNTESMSYTNGDFTFPTALIEGSSYDVKVIIQPTTPNQICLVTGGDNNNGTGIISGSDVSNILVTCNTSPITLVDFYSTKEDENLNAIDVNGSVNNSNDNSVLVNDIDNDTLNIVDPGTFNSIGGIGGSLSISANGTFIYTPPNDVFGQVSFNYQVTDGFSVISSSLIIDVLPVNDAPSFTILGDIDATFLTMPPDNLIQIPNFAFDYILGPGNEASQLVEQFNLLVISDNNNILNSVSLSVNGTLDIDLSFNEGVSTVQLIMQDDGEVINGGNNLSMAVQFEISYIDTVYSNGFE